MLSFGWALFSLYEHISANEFQLSVVKREFALLNVKTAAYKTENRIGAMSQRINSSL